MTKLTQAFAVKAAHPDTGQDKHWDPQISGLGLFCGKRAKTWYFQRDVAGKTQRVRIGPFPTITAAAARETAQDLALDHARGRGKAAMRRAPTLREATDAYLARPKLRSAVNKDLVRLMMHNHLIDWLDRPLDDIDRRAVVAHHAGMRSTPAAGNNVFRALQAIWNHARRTDDLPECPTRAIEWHKERVKQAIIEDIAAWRAEVAALQNPLHRAYYRFLLTTGLRKTEAATLTWDRVHDDRIHLPMTKNGKAFDLPITPAHHALFEPLRELDAVYVFPALRGKRRPMTAPASLSWPAHAHRRTFATFAVNKAGLFEETVGRLLNHTPQSVTGSAYVKVSYKDLAEPMARVAAVFEEMGVFDGD